MEREQEVRVGRRPVELVILNGAVVLVVLVRLSMLVVVEVVRVAHPDSRRTLRARVTGRAEVEIHHEP